MSPSARSPVHCSAPSRTDVEPGRLNRRRDRAGLLRAPLSSWLDEPLPALNGRTPREAAGLKSARPDVIALLKDMENFSARERLEGRIGYNFRWMWSELEIKRPG